MSCQQFSSKPEVYFVNGAGGPQFPSPPLQPSPWWPHPPARERARSRWRSWGSLSVGPGGAVLILVLFLFVFAALGLEAYQILNLKKEIKDLEKVEPQDVATLSAPQKQIGLKLKEEDESDRPAAHVLGRVEKDFSRKTLRWEPKTGQAFTSGGVSYRPQEGSLQVNETALYHIYSRVEFIFKNCSPDSSFKHLVFTRKAGQASALELMVAHRAGFCPLGKHSWTTESYLASAHQLQRGDRVFVNVSHPAALSHSHHGNFFGLYKV